MNPRPRHPIAGLDSRPTHASESRRLLITYVAAITAAALLAILAVVLCKK